MLSVSHRNILYRSISQKVIYCIYSQGAKYGWKRSACDDGFRKNMEYLCHMKELHRIQDKVGNSWINIGNIIKEIEGTVIVGVDLTKWLRLKTGTLDHCLNGVDIYFNAVRHFSMTNYEKNPKQHCDFRCAEIMGNPTIGIQNE